MKVLVHHVQVEDHVVLPQVATSNYVQGFYKTFLANFIMTTLHIMKHTHHKKKLYICKLSSISQPWQIVCIVVKIGN